MVKKVACFFIMLAAVAGILLLVHGRVDSYHGGGHTTEQAEAGAGH